MFTDGRKGGWGRGRKDGCKRMKLVAWYAPILGEDPEVLSLLALLITTHRDFQNQTAQGSAAWLQDSGKVPQPLRALVFPSIRWGQ